ncbi:hypothetical protein [Peribacillus tepidiphilus]|uniref:hypothetical protein n=1 Tax=Peribacillus tepidiphilus TaxID=2652445 RepID=UPI0035B55080
MEMNKEKSLVLIVTDMGKMISEEELLIMDTLLQNIKPILHHMALAEAAKDELEEMDDQVLFLTDES